MLYTRRGDDGSTGLFACDQRITKDSAVAEALGAVDELNSLLGWCKTRASEGSALVAQLEQVQQNLFIVQAELAGAKKTIAEAALRELETWTDAAEKELPPITTFLVAGGTELAALLDFARTVARRAERRAWLAEAAAKAAGSAGLGQWTLAYLNRLSSWLYASARLANHKAGIKEEAPRY
jgi:cob(I)alamin adenosyltransferase